MRMLMYRSDKSCDMATLPKAARTAEDATHLRIN